MKLLSQSLVSLIALRMTCLVAAESIRSVQKKPDYDGAFRAYFNTIDNFKTMGDQDVASAVDSVFPAEENFVASVFPAEENFGTKRKLVIEAVASEIGIVGISVPVLDFELKNMETPIAIRLTSYFAAIWWNCVAVYSDRFDDALTRIRPVIVATNRSMFHSQNRAQCIAQATASYSSLSLPAATSNLTSTLGQFIAVDASIGDEILTCNTTTCLGDLAESSGYNPAVMGKIVAKLAYDISLDDGWNQLGLEQCTANCHPYADTTNFIDREIRPDSWHPILEDDGRGYYSFQQHVTPHIGQKASFRYLPESAREDIVAPVPAYAEDRRREAIKVYRKMREHRLDYTKKVEIEQFDDKLVVVGALINSFVVKTVSNGYEDTELKAPGTILSLERFVHFIQALTAADYDAVVIAWKEKVRYDMIRPTTVIKSWGDEEIETWTPEGDKVIAARDFEAYVRVMPHSEYVSGSACIFQAQAELIDGYLGTMGMNANIYPIVFPVVGDGQVQLTYQNVKRMAAAGSRSRINGGMHFPESVTAATTLCTDISAATVSGSSQLLSPGVNITINYSTYY